MFYRDKFHLAAIPLLIEINCSGELMCLEANVLDGR